MGNTVKFIRDQLNNVHKIGFLATQDASTDANALDDYEEGTWTPAIADNNLDGSGEGQAYSTQVGRYQKVGNRIHFQLRVTISDLGTMTGAEECNIVGLPFTSVNVAQAFAAVAVGFASSLALPVAGQNVTGSIGINVAYINLRLWDGVTGVSVLQVNELSVDASLVVSGSYEV